MLEAPTGTTTTETAQNSDLNNLYSLTYDPNTGHIQNWWRGVYRVVANANLVLANVPKITMDEAQKNRVLGEARFLRAWAYFYAVRIWGDVPLVLLPQNATSPDFYPTRTSQETVYNQIVEDLIYRYLKGCMQFFDCSYFITFSNSVTVMLRRATVP